MCDLWHEDSSVVDTSTPVQYELVRVDDCFPQFEPVIHHEWVPDLLVCGECSHDSLQDLTEGYEEALVSVGLQQNDGRYHFDAREFELLDHSPATAGAESTALPIKLVALRLQKADFGVARRSRLDSQIAAHRAVGLTRTAALLEAQW